MKKISFIRLIGLLLLAALLAVAGGLKFSGNIDDLPFVASGETTIGIYSGSTPFNLAPSGETVNPAIHPKEISDVSARGVSDPFMVYHQGLWYMFFEVTNARSNKSDIGFATSGNGYHWSYQRIVIDEPFDLSYPCVFEWRGEFYMVPETKGTNSVYLYKATSFPSEWMRVQAIIAEEPVAPTFFTYHDTCWMFLGNPDRTALNLYYAADVFGPWLRHPLSPVVVSDKNVATPAGRVIEYDGRLYRFARDSSPEYGNCIRVLEISDLTITTYGEAEISQSPILSGSGEGWNADGMQHIDPHRLDDGSWIACVDGTSDRLLIGLKY
jgi:hypothetical protein